MSKQKRDANGHFLPSSGEVCETCGEALTTLRFERRGRHVLVIHCQKCVPNPMLLLRGY